jgi:hypothetical protein
MSLIDDGTIILEHVIRKLSDGTSTIEQRTTPLEPNMPYEGRIMVIMDDIEPVLGARELIVCTI